MKIKIDGIEIETEREVNNEELFLYEKIENFIKNLSEKEKEIARYFLLK